MSDCHACEIGERIECNRKWPKDLDISVMKLSIGWFSSSSFLSSEGQCRYRAVWFTWSYIASCDD